VDDLRTITRVVVEPGSELLVTDVLQCPVNEVAASVKELR
jgi:hypothetical protein